MDLKTDLKNAITPPSSFGLGGSFRGSRSRMNVMLISTVVNSDIDAIEHRISNCVCPKNQRYFGRSR